jgi:acetylornithine deacetylase/succinyl-diaminopimelate desuccinylase-like protein
MESPMNTRVLDHLRACRDQQLAELSTWLAIPSISTLPAHAADVRRAAQWAVDALQRIGFPYTELVETAGHPIVYAEWLCTPGAPTVLFYGHYDVQPVDPEGLWTSPPFVPTVRDGKLYARGASDDKGQVFMHLKAIESTLAVTGTLPINIKWVIEGEEEAGSVHLDAFLEARRELLAADVVVISDTGMIERGIPSLCYGLRGLAYFQINLRGSTSDLHSGLFGGALANPALVLAQLLARMKDDAGRVAIPGFYDRVRPLTTAERDAYRRLPFDAQRFREQHGVPRLACEAGYTPQECLSARPTFEVNGLLSGFTGEGAKTVLPARAMAKVSMRLVPDQDPEEIAALFAAHLDAIAPPTVELELVALHGGHPWKASLDNPYVRAAARAIEAGFGRAPLYTREGGSIPVVATFQRLLDLPSILFGIGLPDDNLHAPNEKLDLDNFYQGTMAAAVLYEELAAAERC